MLEFSSAVLPAPSLYLMHPSGERKINNFSNVV